MVTRRIYADFNNLDDINRLRLTCAGTKDDLDRYGIQLHEGMALTFYMDDADDEGRPDDILVDGVVQYDPEQKYWVAEAKWDTLRNASDESKPEPKTHPEASVGR